VIKSGLRHPRKGGGKVDLDNGVLLSSRGKSELNLKLSNSSKQSGLAADILLGLRERREGGRTRTKALSLWANKDKGFVAL